MRSLRVRFRIALGSFQVCPFGTISILTLTSVGLCEGLEGMRTGGSRRVHLPPFAPAQIKWGDEGMEELRGETLVLG